VRAIMSLPSSPSTRAVASPFVPVHLCAAPSNSSGYLERRCGGTVSRVAPVVLTARARALHAPIDVLLAIVTSHLAHWTGLRNYAPRTLQKLTTVQVQLLQWSELLCQPGDGGGGGPKDSPPPLRRLLALVTTQAPLLLSALRRPQAPFHGKGGGLAAAGAWQQRLDDHRRRCDQVTADLVTAQSNVDLLTRELQNDCLRRR
jgi:hypothetical protein